MADPKKTDPSYAPPSINTMARFKKMEAGAAGAAAPKPAPAADDKGEAIKARAKSMDSLSVDALIRRAEKAAGN